MPPFTSCPSLVSTPVATGTALSTGWAFMWSFNAQLFNGSYDVVAVLAAVAAVLAAVGAVDVVTTTFPILVIPLTV